MNSRAYPPERDDIEASSEERLIFMMYLRTMEMEGQKKEAIRANLHSLSEKYSRTGLAIADSIDFNVAIERACYLYLYAPCQTRGTKLSLEMFQKTCRANFDKWIKDVKDIKICSVGGGPGCDVIGILNFLRHHGLLRVYQMTAHCTVVDKYEGWESTFHRNLKKFCELSSISVVDPQFIPHDLFERFSDTLKKTIKQSDLIIMNKLISCIMADGRCEKVLKDILTFMKPGALLVFVDNSGSADAKELIEKVAAKCKMEYLHYYCHRNDSKEIHLYELYKKIYNYSCKRKIDIMTIIWQKPAEMPLQF